MTDMTVITARYPGTCVQCGLRFDAGTSILHSPGRAAHNQCPAPLPPATPETVPTPLVALPTLSSVVAFLTSARESGIQYPKARFIGPDGYELKLTLAGSGSRVPDSVNVLVGEIWVGRIMPDGQPSRPLDTNASALEVLRAIAADPAIAAREYGALNAVCSFCGAELTDAGSVEVGYGPTCARRWSLPHHPRGLRVEQAVACV